jgi:hypothetical protein
MKYLCLGSFTSDKNITAYCNDKMRQRLAAGPVPLLGSYGP